MYRIVANSNVSVSLRRERSSSVRINKWAEKLKNAQYLRELTRTFLLAHLTASDAARCLTAICNVKLEFYELNDNDGPAFDALYGA